MKDKKTRKRRRAKGPVCYLQYRSTLAGATTPAIVKQVIDTVWLKPEDIVVSVAGRCRPLIYFHFDRVDGRVYMFNQDAKKYHPKSLEKRHVGNFGRFITP